MYDIFRLNRKKQLPLHPNSTKDERIYKFPKALCTAIQKIPYSISDIQHPLYDIEYLFLCRPHPYSADNLQDRRHRGSHITYGMGLDEYSGSVDEQHELLCQRHDSRLGSHKRAACHRTLPCRYHIPKDRSLFPRSCFHRTNTYWCSSRHPQPTVS